MTQEEDRIRTIAGYLLKNNSRLILGSPPEVVQYVKAAVLQAFTDPSIIVRNAASQDIVAFLGVLEPKNWPECLQQLVNTLDSNDIDRQEVRVLLVIREWRMRRLWPYTLPHTMTFACDLSATSFDSSSILFEDVDY
jgi:hypothetical protein